MDGAVVVDKPAGIGSTDVVRAVRRAANQRRVGHTGTLDPLATGVLVVCLGRATRLVRFLQTGVKVYAAEVVLGIETTTQDITGEVLRESSGAGIDEDQLRAVLAGYVGEIEQIPPMVSAVKVGGERLYERARRGEDVQREPRRVKIHDLVLDRFEPGEQARASFTVTCSSGTYVRTICHDVGADLGCGGALADLRRLRNGAFTVDDAHSLDDIVERGENGTFEEILLPMREAVRGLPSITVDLGDARRIAHGQALPAAGIDGPYAVLLETPPRLLGVYADDGEDARPEVVLVQPDDLEGVGA